MARVLTTPPILMVSQPVRPPWNNSNQNLVRDLSHSLSRRAQVNPSIDKGSPLPHPVNTLLRLLTSRSGAIWHFFFTPNRATSTVARGVTRTARRLAIQTVMSPPRAHDFDPSWAFAHRTVVLSRRTHQQLLSAGVPPSRLVRISPCVDVDTLRPRVHESAPAPLRRLRAEGPLWLYPGDLEFSTGAKRTVQAFARLPPARRGNLVMACRPKTPRAHGAQRKLARQARDLGVAERVHWIGHTAHIHRWLGGATAVLLPVDSLYAKMDYPLVVLEALLLGTPCVVCKGTAVDELAGHGGVLLSEDRTDAVAQAMRTIVDNVEGFRQMAADGIRGVQQVFSPDAIAAQYEELYAEVIAERH